MQRIKQFLMRLHNRITLEGLINTLLNNNFSDII